MPGKRRQRRPRKQWLDDPTEWTELTLLRLVQLAEGRNAHLSPTLVKWVRYLDLSNCRPTIKNRYATKWCFHCSIPLDSKAMVCRHRTRAHCCPVSSGNRGTTDAIWPKTTAVTSSTRTSCRACRAFVSCVSATTRARSPRTSRTPSSAATPDIRRWPSPRILSDSKTDRRKMTGFIILDNLQDLLTAYLYGVHILCTCIPALLSTACHDVQMELKRLDL